MRATHVRWTATTVLLSALMNALPAEAETTIESLEQRIRVLERQLEIQREEADVRLQTAPVVGASSKGFSVRSGDGAYELRVRGLVQLDARVFADDHSAFNDTITFRRVRPTFEGSLGQLVGFRLTPEFAGSSASLVDAYIDLRFDPAATVRAGKVKGPIGLERLQSGGALTFIERGFPTELAPNRDLGVQLQGQAFEQRLSYALGVFNGAADGRDAPASDGDNKKEWAARVFLEPFKSQPGFFQGLGVGLAASFGSKEGGTPDSGTDFKPQYRTPGQNRFFRYDDTVIADGDHRRLSPQGYFYRGGFGLLAEYIQSEQRFAEAGESADILNTAWQVAASYVLTGESAGYAGVAPRAAFGPGGGLGAWEVALRYGELSIDDDAFERGFASRSTQASAARGWTLGLNWYLTTNARLGLNYSRTTFEDGAAGGADRDDENAIFTRAQIAF